MHAAVVTTHGRDCLGDCVAAIAPQVDWVIVVAHGARQATVEHDTFTLPYSADLPNISRMWNLGIDAAVDLGASYVAVLNDDSIVGPAWFADVVRGMVDTGAPIGYAANIRRRVLEHRTIPTQLRMTGYAWVLDPTSGLRLDESMVWWFSDNDIEWRARQSGGVVAVPGEVTHLYPNSTTVGDLAEQAARDREVFLGKWGVLP